MERYHIFKLGLAILFYAAYCIRPMLVNGLRSINKTEVRPEDYLVFYQVQDGIPGVDFPILSNIPRTTFSCQNIDSGYYADLDTDCQVFHICEEGRKISFLCPNGTIFDQSDLICEWWFKVDCANSPNLYHESAELLRENLAKNKASRKVYLDGQERNHGAIMRVEESSSTSLKKGSKSVSPGRQNAITNNGNTRISQGSQSKTIPPSSRAIDRSREQLDQQKPKRYNDADTGNYVNKIDDRKNLKEYHVQFSGTSPALDTASSERHVQVRPTTPSSLNSISSQQGQNQFKNQVNGNRGNIKFRPSFGTEEGKSADEYDLDFPKHKSEIINDDSSKINVGVQAPLIGHPSLSTFGSRMAESDELQVPQETAAFAKNSYNSLRSTARKQPTVNPYPNHRTTYSELKQPTFPTPRFLGGINSVTPQYITTQSINNGKPFVGSTVGVNIYGTKLRTSTLSPETSPFGRHISSTTIPSISTSQVPFFQRSSTSTPTDDSVSRFVPEISQFGKHISSTTIPSITSPVPFNEFASSSTPTDNSASSLLPETSAFEKDISSTTISSVTTQAPSIEISNTSTDKSTSRSVPGISSGRHISSTITPYVSTSKVPPIESSSRFSILSTTAPPLDRSTKRIIDHAIVYGSFSRSSTTTPQPPRGVEIKFGQNENKVAIQLSKSVGGEIPKYGSSVKPPLLKSNAVVHISDLQDTKVFPSSTVKIRVSSDKNTFIGTESSLPTIEDIYRIDTTTTNPPNRADDGPSSTVKTYPPSTTVNDVQSTTKPDYRLSTTSSPKFGTTDKDGYKYQSTTINSISPEVTEGSTFRSTSPRTSLVSDTNGQNFKPEIKSEGGSGFLLKPHESGLAINSNGAKSTEPTTKPVVPQGNSISTVTPDSLIPKDLYSSKYSSTFAPATSKGGNFIHSLKDSTGLTAGVSLSNTGKSSGSTLNLASSIGTVPVGIQQSAGETTTLPDGGAIYEVFTERTESSSNVPDSTTAGPFDTATLRGTPFKTNQETYGDLPATGRTELSNSQRGHAGSTVKSSVQVTLRGSPFKSSQATESTVGKEVFTEGTRSSTSKPVSTVTGRGKPFMSSQNSWETPISTVPGAIYEEFTKSTQTDQPISTTIRPTINAVTLRGRPFKTNTEAAETETTVGGTIYEVFTEATWFPPAEPTDTTARPSHRTVNLRGKPFKAVDSAVDGTEYDVSAEHPQVSTGESGGTTIQPASPNVASIISASDASTGGPTLSSNQLHGEGTTPAPAISENPKYGSVVNPPLLTPDAFVRISDIISASDASTGGPTLSSNQLHGEGTTPAPAISENPKYGSVVNPPLLTPDAFVRISDIQSTSKSVDGTVTQTESRDNINLETTPLPPNESKPTYFISSTAAPLIGTTRTYGSTVLPPLLLKDSIIHVSDVQSTSRPTGDSNTFGKKIKPTIDTVSSTSLPNLKSHLQDVSKYGGFDLNTSKPKDILQSFDIGNNKTPLGGTDLSQNTVGSTLAPDVVSFAGSFKPKPVVISPSEAINLHGGNAGFYVTKNSVYGSSTPPSPRLSSTIGYEQSTPFVNVSPLSGEGDIDIKPPQATLSAPKVESSFDREVPLLKSESQWPRPFQRLNSLGNKERATYLPTESTTSTYVTYKISSARPFMLPQGTPGPTVPSPFKSATPAQNSVYENVDNMISILKEIVNATDVDFSSETPRPGLIVPPSAGPQTLHTLAVYFANALDGIAAEREKLTGEQLDEENKEKLTSLLTQMTMYQYEKLFKDKENIDDEVTTVATGLEDDSDNLIEAPGLRQLARNFSLALSSYLDNPETFRKDLENLRPTEPPQLTDDVTEIGVGDEELLNFSDADAKPSFPPAFPTLPSVSPTWGYILAAKGSEDLDVKNSLNPDLHTSDTQSFVPGFNNIPARFKGSSKDNNKGLPEDHWTDSPGATKLWQSAFSVNPAIVNEHFITTEPSVLEAESTEGFVAEESGLPRLDIPQSEVRYDLRALPKVSVNTTEVRGLLIDFINTTKSDESNRLQRLLRKLNTTETEFLSRMKEIDSNPLTKRLILLLISECGTNATKDIAEQAEYDLSKETLETSQSSSAVASYSESRPNSDIPELVDPKLHDDDQDTRALQLLNSLYTIAAKFGK